LTTIAPTAPTSTAPFDLETETRALLQRARAAAVHLAPAPTAAKNLFLEHVARLIVEQTPAILHANATDLESAQAVGRNTAFLDRLRLTEKSLQSLAATVREVAALPDPVGAITSGSRRPNGLDVRRQRVPLGVIGMVYESRPNVTVDAAALCVKAGNAVVLRGGSEAAHSNAAFLNLLRQALLLAGLPQDAVQAPASLDHKAIDALVSVPGGLDLVIPRGGTALIDAVNRVARVPVIQHYKGVCHVFVHAAADLELAERVVVNAKAQRPGVCNAAEAILIDAAIANEAVPRLVDALRAAGVEVRGCPRTQALVHDRVVPATEADDGCEYLDLIALMRVVDGLQGAIDHIRAFGSLHTEAILTTDLNAAQRFVDLVDASCVMVNASTRFNDGGCLGLGAEIGISTSKLHAYGPMGLESLTTERFVVFGQGQIRT
jgi:glutamate-5-semialdehyde dehydrogenase